MVRIHAVMCLLICYRYVFGKYQLYYRFRLSIWRVSLCVFCCIQCQVGLVYYFRQHSTCFICSFIYSPSHMSGIQVSSSDLSYDPISPMIPQCYCCIFQVVQFYIHIVCCYWQYIFKINHCCLPLLSLLAQLYSCIRLFQVLLLYFYIMSKSLCFTNAFAQFI